MANLSKEALPSISSYPFTNYSGPHITKEDYNRAFNKARLWALKNKEYPLITIARIYHIMEVTI